MMAYRHYAAAALQGGDSADVANEIARQMVDHEFAFFNDLFERANVEHVTHSILATAPEILKATQDGEHVEPFITIEWLANKEEGLIDVLIHLTVIASPAATDKIAEVVGSVFEGAAYVYVEPNPAERRGGNFFAVQLPMIQKAAA